MRIFIPTRGRIDRQHTWDRLPDETIQNTVLFCPPEEVSEHTRRGRRAIPRPRNGIANVRQDICNYVLRTANPTDISSTHFMMLDDDLAFFHRISEDRYNLQPATSEQIVDIFYRLAEALHRYPAVGISPRQMNNQHFPAQFKTVTKMNAAIGFDAGYLCQLQIRFDEVELMEDYHVVLSLLERGYENYVITNAAWDQVGATGASGGASLYRTPELQERAAHRLAELHPNFVKVVKKTPKGGWGEGSDKLKERTDVRIQWRKAYDFGCSA